MEANPNARLEAFCDAVFAIAVTLLIIDIRLPSSESIRSNAEVWRALGHLAPAMLAFLMSFVAIFITWVNHHATMKLMNRTSASFIFSNGFLLLTVVFLPFPTSMLGELLMTDHAAPAVVLYDSVLAFQAVAWILFSGTAIRNGLLRDDRGRKSLAVNARNGYFACTLYATLAILALWFPVTVAVITLLSWVFWLILGINIKHS